MKVFFSFDLETNVKEGKLWIETSLAPLKKIDLWYITLEIANDGGVG